MTTAVMSSALDAQRVVVQEMYAEREAIAAVQEPDFTACAKRNGLRTSIEVRSHKRNGDPLVETIYASKVYAAWRTFRVQPDVADAIKHCTLTGVVNPIALRFVDWLQNGYTARYKHITKSEHLLWLKAIARLCVQRRIMEAKLQNGVFMDDYSRLLMAIAIEAAKHYQEIAKVAHRVQRSHMNGDEIRRTFTDVAKDFWRTQHARLQQATPTPLPPMLERTSADLLPPPDDTPDSEHEGLWQ